MPSIETESAVSGSAIASYLERVDAGDAAGAAMHFTEGALYLRPGHSSGVINSSFELLRGAAQIREFLAGRGRPRRGHEIYAIHRENSTEMVFGVGDNIDDDNPTVFYFSFAVLDRTGKIDKYVSAGIPLGRSVFLQMDLGLETLNDVP